MRKQREDIQTLSPLFCKIGFLHHTETFLIREKNMRIKLHNLMFGNFFSFKTSALELVHEFEFTCIIGISH